MKLRNLFYLLFALPLVFAACETPGDDKTPEEPAVATLTVKTDAKTFDAEGGSAIVSYTLENAPEGAVVSATCEANWVIELDVTPSSVMFDVKANDSEEPRETKVVISYEEQVFEVPVQQEGKEAVVAPAAPKFELTSNELMEFPYTDGAGTVYFTLENPVEGVNVVAESSADWLTISTIEDGAINFFVAANEGEVEREATITATYGMLDPIVVTVKQAYYIDPSTVVEEFKVIECFASCENGGLQWDVYFVEKVENRGEIQTRISFALEEANTQRITDGTYTVENGGILLNTANLNGFSTYHSNSDATDIYAAEFEVSTDTVNKLITFTGTFSAGAVNVQLNYTGEVRGMDLGEAVSGAIEHTEWKSFEKNWQENKELLFTAVSSDGSLKAVFDFYDYDDSKVLAEGTYEVSPYYDGIGAHLRASSYFKYNGVEAQLESGSATVEHITGGYKITYHVVDKNKREFTGVIEGTLTGDKAVNPA